MNLFKRDDRHILRAIQKHIWETMLYEGVVVEQLGTVDVYVHMTNPATHLNCVTPHKGVAWIRREDLLDAFTGLQRLGRTPRLVFLDALFPEAFTKQIKMMDLTLEDERMVMVYRPLYGPSMPDELVFGRLPDEHPSEITTSIATTREELATWLRVFRAGYYNTEALTVPANDVQRLVVAVEKGEAVFILAHYQETPLGATRLALRPPTAELEAVATAPLWHDMGLEAAMIAAATRAATERKCDVVFSIALPRDFMRLYRIGFVDLTHVMIFWQAEEYAQPKPETTEQEAT
ncbi:MAG: hypothetical protein GYB65_00290 [Chloroflexi bacterium]|nr:hypothetical protein [Chloroflexota bacterium]